MREKSCIQLDIRARTFNKCGKEISNTGWKPAHSFVQQFLQALRTITHNIAMVIKDVAGAANSWTGTSIIYGVAAAGVENLGIIVGTGTTAPTNIDFVMETPIAHGVGAGQLQYGAQSSTEPGVVGANVDFVMTRTFTNGSGNTITIEEVGVYWREGAAESRLMIHDLLTIIILNTASATVEYRLRTTV